MGLVIVLILIVAGIILFLFQVVYDKRLEGKDADYPVMPSLKMMENISERLDALDAKVFKKGTEKIKGK